MGKSGTKSKKIIAREKNSVHLRQAVGGTQGAEGALSRLKAASAYTASQAAAHYVSEANIIDA